MPSYRTTPDGKDYRLVITVTDEVTTCVIERIREGTWVPVQTWNTDVTARTRAPERRLKITESAANHGWQVPADAWGPHPPQPNRRQDHPPHRVGLRSG